MLYIILCYVNNNNIYSIFEYLQSSKDLRKCIPDVKANIAKMKIKANLNKAQEKIA